MIFKAPTLTRPRCGHRGPWACRQKGVSTPHWGTSTQCWHMICCTTIAPTTVGAPTLTPAKWGSPTGHAPHGPRAFIMVQSTGLKRERSLKINKVEKILRGSLDSITSPSTSVKIQSMGGKICLRSKGKTLLGIVNELLHTKSLLTSPSNVLRYSLK